MPLGFSILAITVPRAMLRRAAEVGASVRAGEVAVEGTSGLWRPVGVLGEMGTVPARVHGARADAFGKRNGYRSGHP